ncbi:MAG: hypothetical protein IMZ41_01295 [Actinobacteria bacterium]|nr:hypothetical protein [Actinomycetota bacterium]
MRKIVVKDEDTGQDVLMYEDIAEPKIIYVKTYKGKIERVEDRKIYFIVDEEFSELIFGSGTTGYHFKDVKDYQVVFDLDSYTLEYDPLDKDYSVTVDKDYKSPPTFQPVYYDGDYLTCDSKNFHSAGELEFLVGNYLRVQETIREVCRTGITNKYLCFYSEE